LFFFLKTIIYHIQSNAFYKNVKLKWLCV